MRREIIGTSLATLLTLTQPQVARGDAASADVSWHVTSEQALEHMGIDGRTVLTARNLPVTLGYLWNPAKPRAHVTLNGVDVVLSDVQTATIDGRQQFFATIPTVTGTPAHYRAYVGNGGLVLSDIRVDQTHKSEKISSYLVVDRYYDNKIVNASTAVIRVAESMVDHGIEPGRGFSYLKEAQIGSLLATHSVLIGKGIGVGGLVPMEGGGICTSVTAVAKMARRAEVEGKVRIIASKPHSVPSLRYFMNLDDPTPRQLDATAAYPWTDFQFRNTSGNTLYVVPRLQIIADEEVSGRYNGFRDSSAVFVLSVTLQTTPPQQDDIEKMREQLATFRASRGI